MEAVISFITAYIFTWKGHSFLTRLVIEKNRVELPEISLMEPPFPQEGGISPYREDEECGPFSSGAPINLLEFVSRHVRDPDCGIDRDLKVSWLQEFMGGSQGFRHMYYPFGRWRFPLILFPQGDAPERAAYFFKMVNERFREGDFSSGWLFLSWSLHYVEDLSQPFHTCQTSFRFIVWKSPVKGTTEVTKNFHYAYEDAIYLFLLEEISGKNSYGILDALSSPVEMDDEDIKRLGKSVAKRSAEVCDDVFTASFDIWRERLYTTRRVRLSEEDVKRALLNPSFEKLMNATRISLRLLSGSIIRFFSILQK